MDKVRPDFTWPGDGEVDFTGDWDGPNMLWVEKDAQGQTVFHLEQAFAWQGPGQKVQWVLVEPSPDADKDGPLASERDWWDMVSNRLLPERIVIDTPPKARLADGEVGSVYARRFDQDARGGAVYEVGLLPEGNLGTQMSLHAADAIPVAPQGRAMAPAGRGAGDRNGEAQRQ